MKINIRCMSLFLLFIFLFPAPTMPFSGNSDDAIVLITDFTYQTGERDSRDTSRALALFGAKSRAVVQSAKYLSHKGLLEHYGKKQNEIFCLAVNEIESSIMDEKYDHQKKTYHVKVKAEVKSTHFIQAEIKDLELEKKESGFSYEQEMEQPVSQAVNPGQELSRAYRYIRQRHWRISIIYLNHLGKKYPHWGDVHLAKALAYYGMHKEEEMMDALKKACSLGNREACNDLESFIQTPDNGLKLE